MSTILPDKFIEYVNRFAPLQGLSEALATQQPTVSVRINLGKQATMPANAPVVPWADDCGYYIDGERPRFTFDPALHQGLYYVQDASSMALRAAIKHIAHMIQEPIRYLDACAAPGGKTTCAIDALPCDAVIVANEYDFQRAPILAENVIKWGSPRTVVSRGDTARFTPLTSAFHIIAADVPCSGEGMMRKDAKAVAQWSPALVEQCAQRQRQIIDNLWPALTPGGFFIYSTCTFNREENELMLQYMADTYGAIPVAIPTLDAIADITPGIDTGMPCYRFIPGKTRGEGLFLAVLQKPGEIQHLRLKPVREKDATKDTSGLISAIEGRFVLRTVGADALYAIPADMAPFETLLDSRLDIIHRGIRLATIKGRDAIPHQSLAMSTALRHDAFPHVEVDTDNAIDYLRRQSLTLPDGTPRGYVLLTHGSRPLGFMKNLGNRANNLYPDHWKILSAAK